MRQIFINTSIASMILLTSCTSTEQPPIVTKSTIVQHQQEVEKPLLQDIYTYEFNQIEPQHQKFVDEWLQESHADHKKQQIYFLSLGTDDDPKDGYKYMYILGKGYRTFETAFMYSQDNEHTNASDTTSNRETSRYLKDKGKGTLYVKGVKGEATDEVLLRLHYNPKYVSATGLVERFLK
ncbi:hypothetical protein [Paenibacillus kyungheensis]